MWISYLELCKNNSLYCNNFHSLKCNLDQKFNRMIRKFKLAFHKYYLSVGGSSCSSFKAITPLRFLSELNPERSSDEFCLLGKSQSTAACHT